MFLGISPVMFWTGNGFLREKKFDTFGGVMSLTIKITTEYEVFCDDYENEKGHQKIGDVRVLLDGLDVTDRLHALDIEEIKEKYCKAMREECA